MGWGTESTLWLLSLIALSLQLSTGLAVSLSVQGLQLSHVLVAYSPFPRRAEGSSLHQLISDDHTRHKEI